MYRALIVEDEVRTREGLKKYISWIALGFDDVREAATGAEALETIRKFRPDLVLLDIRLPGIDGLTVLERLRGEMPHTVVIIISGFQDFSYARKAIRYQAFEYLLKPVNPEEVDRTIRRAFTPAASAFSVDEIESNGGSRSCADAAFERALACMRLRFAERLTVRDVARESFVSESWCARIIKEKTGKSFLEVLTEIRLERSRDLLASSNETVAGVSALVGYADPKYFASLFKERYGIPPNQYKNSARYGGSTVRD